MSKIAILFLLFAVAFAAETKEVELETTIDDYIEIAKCFLAQDYLVKDALDIILFLLILYDVYPLYFTNVFISIIYVFYLWFYLCFITPISYQRFSQSSFTF